MGGRGPVARKQSGTIGEAQQITSAMPTYRYQSDVTERIGDHALVDMSDRAEAD